MVEEEEGVRGSLLEVEVEGLVVGRVLAECICTRWRGCGGKAPRLSGVFPIRCSNGC